METGPAHKPEKRREGAWRAGGGHLKNDYAGIDFRAQPERYRIGRGEEGVLNVEPYKSELLPLWRFRTPAIARESAAALWAAFEDYRAAGDFVGMDMARKFIQMGYTRARRYANHAGGRKHGPDGTVLPRVLDEEKAAAAAIFKEYWDYVRADGSYQAARAAHKAQEKRAGEGPAHHQPRA